MSLEPRTIVHENALVFVQEVEKAIHEGLRVTDSNTGAPMLNTILKEVYMVPAEVAVAGPAAMLQFTEYDGKVTIEGYDNLVLLLTVQEAILAGYRVSAVDFMPHGLKNVELEKAAKQQVFTTQEVKPVVDESLIVQPVPEAAPAKTKTRRTK